MPTDFWLDTSPTPKDSKNDAKPYEEYRKRGGLPPLYSRLPSARPVFPPRSEGGYGKNDGYNDSRKPHSNSNNSRQVTFVTEPTDLE